MRWLVLVEDPYARRKFKIYKTERGARNYIKRLIDKEPCLEPWISLFHEEPIGFKLAQLQLPY